MRRSSILEKTGGDAPLEIKVAGKTGGIINITKGLHDDFVTGLEAKTMPGGYNPVSLSGILPIGPNRIKLDRDIIKDGYQMGKILY